MRLSALAHQQGLASFSAEDFEFVSSQLSHEPDRLILVGGQAIEVWGVLLDEPAPTGDTQPLTEDADWLGNRRDAKWLCDRLGSRNTVELQFAGEFDPSVSLALAFIQRPDKRILLMDFMRAIAGPSAEEVRKLAVRVELRNGAVISVMHPLLCLESRFANLALIPEKRLGNGPMQAQWAINIVKSYLLRMVRDRMPADQIAKACRRIAETAEYKHGRYCHLEFGLDALQAVSAEVMDAVGGRFVSHEWPRIVERVRSKQARWREIAARKQPQLRAIEPNVDLCDVAVGARDLGSGEGSVAA